MRARWRGLAAVAGLALALGCSDAGGRAVADTGVQFERDVLPLLKKRCAACHGPLKAEAGLTLISARYVARGSDEGPVVIAGDPGRSRLWRVVESDEMPEDEPLSASEKGVLREWIASGAPGLPSAAGRGGAPIEHWAFAHLDRATMSRSVPAEAQGVRTTIDRLVAARLAEKGLQLSPEADRATLIRRVAFDLTGLPPTMEELQAFLLDSRPQAYSAMVDRYLASVHYGERWGKYWLDVAGYADSDGYFIDFDQDRPLAFLYRDYVIRSFNSNKPFDQFVREQLAGDELAGNRPGQDLTPEQIDMLVATHFLRNSEDGSDRNMGTPRERITTRYATLEGTMRIVASSLLGLTIQCARCHDHKFEPITQREYYAFQSIFYPAFDIEDWITPKNRWVDTAPAAVLRKWKDSVADAQRRLVRQKAAFADWERANRPRGELLWHADFDDDSDAWQKAWRLEPPTKTAPKVRFGRSGDGPRAYTESGGLVMRDVKPSRLTWITTRETFDWTPERPGEWVQLTFDLVDGSRATKGRMARFGFFIATRSSSTESSAGNVLIDSSPAYGIDVITNALAKGGMRGQTGARFRGYFPGDNYGIRVTNIGDGKFELEHVLNGLPEEKSPGRPRVVRSLVVSARELPDGGIGFAYRGEGLHFRVDNIRVERSSADVSTNELQRRRKKLNASRDAELKKIEDIEREIEELEGSRPGKVAWVTDRSDRPLDAYFLVRGDYFRREGRVAPDVFSFLAEAGNRLDLNGTAAAQKGRTTGRRLAFARWITHPDAKASALLARVTMNRVWQRYFGRGLVPSTENLGYSGDTPSHPLLLDHLAMRFIESGWNLKEMHRLILLSAVYRQSSSERERGTRVDPENRLLWRAPVKRLDAEAMRDAMLAVAGKLDRRVGGPYVPTRKLGNGEVVVDETTDGAFRRSVYLQQRRSRQHTLLKTFDVPKMVVNCIRRDKTTVPLQSLSLLNSPFVMRRAEEMADRLAREVPSDAARIERAFELAWGRKPTQVERDAAKRFLAEQPRRYQKGSSTAWAWSDLCHALLASNGFLYVE